ncbi:MAG: hypothetical protein AAF664_13965, partial [Planctomycetota bacterium]
MTIEDYLLPPVGKTWQWCDDGEAVEWHADTLDGFSSTIAFSGQLHQTLSRLYQMNDGLPSLAVVLLLESVASRRHPSPPVNLIVHGVMERQVNSDFMKMVTDYLMTVSNASSQSKSAEKVTELIGFGLAESRQWLRAAVSGAEAEAVLQWLAMDRADRELLQTSRVSRSLCRRRQQHFWETMVHLARTGLDEQSFESWKRTGSKDIPEVEEDVLEEPPQTMADLIHSLKEDSELSGLADAASHAASVLTIPRHPSRDDAMPMGGVSDIVNRGTPDRLLMTELAADSLLLAARIATGQALYVRREMPPTDLPKRRAILVEQSVRTWGRVRFSMAAVAMAITNVDQRNGNVESNVWTVSGTRCYQESLFDREGVLSLLERVEPTLLPVEGLDKQ